MFVCMLKVASISLFTMRRSKHFYDFSHWIIKSWNMNPFRSYFVVFMFLETNFSLLPVIDEFFWAEQEYWGTQLLNMLHEFWWFHGWVHKEFRLILVAVRGEHGAIGSLVVTSSKNRDLYPSNFPYFAVRVFTSIQENAPLTGILVYISYMSICKHI